MTHTLSVKQAIWRGLLVVNGPVMVLIVGPLAGFSYLVDRHVVSRDYNWVGLPVFIAGLVLAWLRWSFSVPRWRIWAFERVRDIPALKREAVAVGLTWPDAHFFERTEIKSKALAERQRELDPPE
jgi:hypothetical protein